MRVPILFVLAASCQADFLEDFVVEAIKTAQQNLEKRDKNVATDDGLVQTQKANADSQFEQIKGDLLSECTKIVVEKFGVGVLDELAALDVDELLIRATSEARKKRQASFDGGAGTGGVGTGGANCGKKVTDCKSRNSNNIRSITGICNNPVRSSWGAAVTPVRRLVSKISFEDGDIVLLKASYADGFNAIRTKGVLGTPLPSTREISNKLHQEGATPAFDFSRNHFYMQFGQWIAHDIIFMPSSVDLSGRSQGNYNKQKVQNCRISPDLSGNEYSLEFAFQGECHDARLTFKGHGHQDLRNVSGPRGKTLDCSSCESPKVSNNCAPIPVPKDDAYFKAYNNGTDRCIRLTRALNAQKGLGVRIQINQNTHFLDLSSVYGSEECEGASVRSFINGELKTYVHNGDILPPQNKNDTNCQSKNPHFCFTAGDFRNSLHPGLVPLHSIYIKEHNRIAALFKKSNPNWTDQQIFEETRRVNIAQYQHQVYAEYLPGVVGEKLMNDFKLHPLKSGFSKDYSSSTKAALTAEFAGAAFRFGHGQARKDFPRVTNKNTTAGTTVDIGNNIFYVDSHYAPNQGGMASFLEGMMQHAIMKSDNEFSFPIRNQLFEIRGQPASGVDLVAVNIMRGRDVGLFPYNDYRSLAGLKKAGSFDDLKAEMDLTNVEALKKVYAHVDDIDLYTGIMLERPTPGAAIGPTGGYIIAEQFAALKRGDRFFYEHEVRGTRGLKREELDAVRRTHLAKVICMNSAGMDLVPKSVFNLQSERVSCSSLPEIDIRYFTSSPPPPPPSPRRPIQLRFSLQ